jgi:hypothetical protein
MVKNKEVQEKVISDPVMCIRNEYRKQQRTILQTRSSGI